MEYIVMLNHCSNDPQPITDSHGFVEKFAEYSDALYAGEEYKRNKDCYEYGVYERADI